jgi:4-hydroxybenzoate polyprenyltransferase
MVDKADDLKIGIKTSAITFGRFDVLAVMGCYAIYILSLFLIGWHLGFGWVYQLGLLGAVLCALHHFVLIRRRNRAQCFKAFLHNHWLGFSVFLGTALDFMVR